MNATLARTGERLGRAEQKTAELIAQLSAAKQRIEDYEREFAALRTERDQLLAENELVHARVAELFASNEEYHRKIAKIEAEVHRLEGILSQIYGSRTWKLHLLLERVRGRSS